MTTDGFSMNDHERLHDVAVEAQMMLVRVGGEGGVLEQIAAGEWDKDLTEHGVTEEATALIMAMRENVRYTRATLGSLQSSGLSQNDWVVGSASTAATTRLPFNRKERHFTGTVFPMIVASDGFAHLDRLLALCGLEDHVAPGLEGLQEIQFFTEYSFKESLVRPEDRARFADAPKGGDTPDVVIMGPGWLLAIEAKMYDQPDTASMNAQLRRQSGFVAYWASAFGIPQDHVSHVALLPSELARRLGDLDQPTVTWEQVAEAYRAVAPRYWIGQLDYALQSYRGLAGLVLTYGVNAQGHRTGAEIVGEDLLPGRSSDTPGLDPEIAFAFMGRNGGIQGPALTEDLATGQWRDRKYEVRVPDAPNDNWFPIADFLDKIKNAGP